MKMDGRTWCYLPCAVMSLRAVYTHYLLCDDVSGVLLSGPTGLGSP